MAGYDIVYTTQARAALRKQPAKRAGRILDIVERIAADTFTRHPMIKPLKGVPGGFRYRLGSWRILYQVDQAGVVITVLDIRPRGGAY